MAEMVFGNPLVVISPEYCAPHHLQISIKKKLHFLAGNGYEVKDAASSRILFKVENIPTFFNSKVVVFDPAGNSIITLRRKAFTWRTRWKVYRGESKEEKDFIFSARTSSAFQFTTNLDVFLAGNTSEQVCDYKMKTSFAQSTCDIYVKPSSTLIAQMQKKVTAGSIFLGKDNFMVTLQPNVDQAFIVALIVILQEIVDSRRRNQSSG
ncbi:PREDICTED: protein LURP-one-related 15-like [Ipomoea nil]|uniref:protein LURP-one-related 15-like n=1 Tax=Ipomoea nil TaxID=35883 RepID=UPI0009018130|nr:PREDICTED: protein LURP-one-related 15-like [Ipomoea nil]